MNVCKECSQFRAELNQAGYCKSCRPDSGLSNSLQIHVQRPKRGVRTPYTQKSLEDSLKVWRASGASLRTIANNHFEGRISHSVIQKCLQGEFPKSNELREALGLPTLVAISGVNGYVAEGAETLGSFECAVDKCKISFIPNNSNRKYCYTCSPPRRDNEQRVIVDFTSQ